jgi:hypothetical protein
MRAAAQTGRDGKFEKLDGGSKLNDFMPDSHDWNALNWAQPSWMKDRSYDSHSGIVNACRVFNISVVFTVDSLY